MTQAVPTLREGLVGAIPHLRAFAISLTGDHHLANDLVQDTLLKAWTHRERFEPGTNLKAWLFTILRNTYFSEFRRRRREVQDVDGVAAASLVSLPEQQGHLDLEDFRTALGLLSEEQREALLLVGAEGFSYEVAAAISGCAVGTVKSRVNRARAKLAEHLSLNSVDDLGPEFMSHAVVTTATRT